MDLHTPSGAEGNADAADESAPLADGEGADASSGNAGAGATTIQTPGQKVSVNVLNDIGNMLANLTDELDAMLEEEKRIGLNIDSE